MSVIRPSGVQVKLPATNRTTDDEIEKARDIALCRMRGQSRSWRAIGKFLGLSHEGARYRWRALPEDVREFYRRASLG